MYAFASDALLIALTLVGGLLEGHLAYRKAHSDNSHIGPLGVLVRMVALQ